jgi:hypothetical protein
MHPFIFQELLTPIADWTIATDLVLDKRRTRPKAVGRPKKDDEYSPPEQGYLVVTDWHYDQPENPLCGHGAPMHHYWSRPNKIWEHWCQKCGPQQYRRLNRNATTQPQNCESIDCHSID